MKRLTQYMWFSTGHKELSTAIEDTILKGFTQDAGDREYAANVLIIVTFTPLDNQSAALALADTFTNNRIKPIVLNLAGIPAANNLATMTGDADMVIEVTSPDDLTLMADVVIDMITRGKSWEDSII